ncbi:hypothetical protein [Candidatus Poseidonia alphae]|uniref:hypothetical protein n=1 Tax=Candidatus Poseidonia alphae TaxID=1915863 RepID=UPI0030C7813E
MNKSYIASATAWLEGYENGTAKPLLREIPFEVDPADLVEGDALTSLFVDHLHGMLPKHHDEERITHHLEELLRRLFRRAENRMELIEILADFTGEKSEDIQLCFYITHHLWHELCFLRRILWRTLLAVNPELAIQVEHETDSDNKSRSTTLRRLETICSRLNLLILDSAKNTFHRLNNRRKDLGIPGTAIPWYELAVLHEATLLLRSRKKVSLALTYAKTLHVAAETGLVKIDGQRRFSENSEVNNSLDLSKRFETLAFMPASRQTIAGMVAFNPQVFTENKGVQAYLEAAKYLSSMSQSITLNSSGAASEGLKDWTNKTPNRLIEVWLKIANKFMLHQEQFAISSYLHIESALRVLILNASYCFNISSAEVKHQGKPYPLIDLFLEMMVSIYQNISTKLENSTAWSSGIIDGKIKQNSGMAFSNIAKVRHLRQDGNDADSDLRRQVINIINQGWDDQWDCPVRLSNSLQQAVFQDFIRRATSSPKPALRSMEMQIGDPSVLNPLNSSAFTQFLWGGKGKQHNSKHIKHFPQGNINKAQICMMMAYMQALVGHDESRTTQGMFGTLSESIRFSDKWVLSDLNPKPQFTLGHISKPGKKKINRQLSENNNKSKEKKYSTSFRSQLKRVNRMDSMMYLGTSLNLIENLISKELGGERSQRMFNDAARACSPLPFSIDGQNVHIHDVIHAAQEISQSPMWLTEVDDDMLGDEDAKAIFVRMILRYSLGRLSLLAIRTEQMARAISQHPIREPYLSSCALIIDQIRVLIRYHITDWRTALENSIIPSYDIHSTKFQPDHFDELNQYLTKNKGHQSKQFDPENFKDRKRGISKPINDVALNYLMSQFFNTNEEMDLFMFSLRERMDFQSTIGSDWNSLLRNSIFRRAEAEKDLVDEELETLETLGEKIKLNSTNVGIHPKHVREAYEHLVEETDREWILWARLAFFPLTIDGRILRSGTSFAELNQHDSNIESRKSKPPQGRSILWGKTLEAYNLPFLLEDL